MFCLSSSIERAGPLLAERFPNLSKESVSRVHRSFAEAAWKSIGLFVAEKSGCVDDPYSQCARPDEKSALLWQRLGRSGIVIDRKILSEDLARFEHQVLQGVALFLLIDSLSVSEVQIASDHKCFQSDTGLSAI